MLRCNLAAREEIEGERAEHDDIENGMEGREEEGDGVGGEQLHVGF